MSEEPPLAHGGSGWRRALQVARAAGLEALHRSRRADLALISAGLTFYAALTLVPLALWAFYGAGVLLGPDRVIAIADDLSRFLEGPLGIDELVEELARMGPGLGLSSLAASLLAALTYGEGLLRAISTYHDAAPRSGSAWRGRAMVVPYVLVYPGLAAVALLAVDGVDRLVGEGAGAWVLGTYLTFLVGWALLTLQLAFLYRVFAPGSPSSRALAWGAGATASFLAGMSLGWVPVLRLGVGVGRAFGGSEAVGRLVLIGIYLLAFQVVLLTGHHLVSALDARRSRTAGP
ncbi:YhjD/YihY/BrkB family envelope integrity protein [Euzebya sp.]|uniref:YhjD/YihY/BrkB family envelope integrity protein n=1 Tax=Euzebya sp. TaxID=1971409 RepID=UPI003518335D